MRYHVALLAHNPWDSTSFYRAYGPWGSLYRTHDNLQLITWSEVGWASLKWSDVVFFQRPATPDDLKIMNLVKKNRRKIIIDYDDDLLSVPKSNPAHDLYGKPEIIQALKDIMGLADIITVSTEELRNALSPYNRNIVVVPNALDDDLFEISKREAPQTKNILWRGTSTHREDLEEISDQLVQIIKDAPEWRFNFWGFRPPFTYPPKQGRDIPPFNFPNVHCMGPTDIVHYMHNLKSFAPSLVVVPLKDCAFNKSKSSCAWLEAAAAGAVVVGPDWKEWHHKGILNYKTPQEFGDAVRTGIDLSPEESRSLNDSALDEIREKYLLSRVNKMRWGVLESL